jgi:membrane associated rhomboid family serine protease
LEALTERDASSRSITLIVVSSLSDNLRSRGQLSSSSRPSMCRSCGAIVGGGQQECAVCGASVSGAGPHQGAAAPHQGQPPVAADKEAIRFARAVLDRPYKFTIVLLVANIFMFVLMWQASGLPFSLLTPLPFEVLLPFGAKLNYFIHARHEWWRFVTPMFLHVNLLHLLVNMYSLWMVGPYVEKIYGSAKFVVFWVLTGVAGVVASYLTVRPNLAVGPLARFIFKVDDVPSAGASGALFGLVGVLFVFGIKFRHELPEGFRRAFGTGLLPMIMLNLFIGYAGRGFIDNAAHLGGFVSGAALALAAGYRRPGERSRVAAIWSILQVAAIGLVAISFLMTAKHFRDWAPSNLVAQPAPATASENPAYLLYAKAMNDGQEAFVVAVHDRNAGNVNEAIRELEQAPQLDEKSNELRDQLKLLLLRAQKSVTAPTPARGKNAAGADAELTREFALWRTEYNSWLKTSGRNHSGLIQLVPAESPQVP